MSILSNTEPVCVFNYFEQICRIPHGSGNTKAISDYCVSFAKQHNLKYFQDEHNNIIIWKAGTPGYENSAPVIIQGHMDMVCEKDSTCNIDFENEGLKLQLENGILSAKGTTLGGDDGIAIAYALAILASNDIPHPPLEAVFTVDEEIGMLGATALDCSQLKSRIMLNIDSEEEGYLLVSCAGGATVTAHLPVNKTTCSGIPFTIKINGLKGGHSGVEIDKGRANSNVIMGRTLFYLSKKFTFNILSVSGGLKDNAIPRETTAELIFKYGTDTEAVTDYLKELNSIYTNEYQSTDSNINIEISSCLPSSHSSIEYEVFDDITTNKTITALFCLPNGIQRMSHDIEGLVQTSLNLGILKTTDTEVLCSYSVRSSIGTEKEELMKRITCLVEALGGSMTYTGEYPAWEYRKESPLRDLMTEIFEEQYGRKPVIQALHAGVECGIFSDKLSGIDCVSYGPDMENIHTPKESMNVESVLRTWNYTLEILKRLK